MENKITLEQYKTAYRLVEKIERRKSFFRHLGLYLIVNFASILINYIFTPDFVWFIFPLFFWGIGILWNFLGSFIWIDKTLERRMSEAEKRAIKE
ncbi:MAG: 2TM domain-containing protein [Methanomicrobiales archaeon]